MCGEPAEPGTMAIEKFWTRWFAERAARSYNSGGLGFGFIIYRTPNGMHVGSERGFPDGLSINNGGNIDGEFPLSVWPEPEPTIGLLNDGWVARSWSEIPEDWLILSTSRVAFKRGDDTGGSRPGGLWTGYVLCRPPVDKTDDGESE